MATCSSLHTRLQIKGGAPHLISISSRRNSYFSMQSKLHYNNRRSSGDSIKIPVLSAPWLGSLTKDKKLSLFSVAADINQVTTDTDTEKTPTSESIPKTLESTSSNGGVSSSKSVKRSSLTAREKLRAARVLKRVVDNKPAKSEFGSQVLDALRESERGKKRSRLPEAPSNMLDDSKRGMPKQGLTFDFPGGFDLFVIVLSFVLITTTMVATTFIVWKLGAIHFND